MIVFFWLSNLEKEPRAQHQEKEISRSRIPRLILRPHLPHQQQNKVSPASESPFSEEESREFNPSSSGRSGRTISSNSFCSGTVALRGLPPPPPQEGVACRRTVTESLQPKLSSSYHPDTCILTRSGCCKLPIHVLCASAQFNVL